ncbi:MULTISPECIES: transcription antitermination factor NusB [unclassified Fibrobacter]|uniref:transcription antitermination factor NusB n=1 Tax=unclassified Fibrobacter TaxID=2634177 RepID=UPI0025C2DA31|nr:MULTISPECIES: transcription antitermination factor NusB [unclassified Fibrobacter]
MLLLDDSLKERMDAYRVLLLWQKDGSFIKESGLSPFAMELALGVCRRHLYLQYFLKTLVKKMPSLEVATVLEMGIFQMFFMEIPDHAAVSTSVELTKAANLGEGSARLVNAVLHSARRSGLPALPQQRVRRVSIESSVPEWLVRRWFDIYGGDRAESLAKATLERPVEWIRVNLQKTSAPVLAQKLGLTGASILYDRYIQVPEDAKLKPILESESFAKGEFSMQNPSAYEVVKLLDLKPGLKVWDACAAPGGKSALMGEMDSSLDILASDVSAFRVEKMHDVVDRLGLKNVRLECIDALSPQQSKFDRILLDVPCSNMGVMPRRPESKYRITQDSMKELAELQYGILESASASLVEGGILVYATCSPDPLETTQVVNRFLKAHPELVKRGEHVLPGAQDNRFDGFFAQALERKKV